MPVPAQQTSGAADGFAFPHFPWQDRYNSFGENAAQLCGRSTQLGLGSPGSFALEGPIFLAARFAPTTRMSPMFDEMERLRTAKELHDLLEYYQPRAGGDRHAWQDRLQEMAGVTARELARLHGELIAYGWLEQNTGVIPLPKVGAAPGSYRITTAGIRALREAREAVTA
jgi:hypothetical protein